MKTGLPDAVFCLLGVALLVLGWELLGRNFSGLVVAGPSETLAALFELLQDRKFLVSHLVPTLKRVGLALCLSMGTGLVLGILAGFVKPFRLMLAPLRWILTSIPAVVILVVFMLWFGVGTTMVVSIAAVMTIPVVYVNVCQAMLEVDRNLLEMAQVYRLPLSMRLGRIYVMALAGPFLSSAIIAVGNGIRLVILGEMLGANEGMGHALAISRSSLQTEELYALALLAMLLLGIVELFLVHPARKIVQKRQV